MQILKPDNLALLYTPCIIGDFSHISIAVMACFSINGKAASLLLDESPMWDVIANRLGKEEPFDMGYPKQRGEFLVYGAAHSVQPVTGLMVSVNIGDISKKLQVSGPRYWNPLGMPENPEPFRSLAICWKHAYGGQGFEANPDGIGFTRDSSNRQPLPAIQTPDHLISSPNDRPEPAGFTAIDQLRPQRTRYLGRFDDAWLKERWPHYPHDTDPEYFNTAPQDQRIRGFFRGDEPLLIRNMHPEQTILEGRLPELRARIFLNRKEGENEAFFEVKNRPETVWIFPEDKCGVLLFRGTAQVSDETMDDLTHLMATWEPLNSKPESRDYYFEKFQDAVNSKPAELAEPVPPSAPPPPPSLPDPEPEKPAPPPPKADKELAEMQGILAKAEAQADAVFARLGMTREQALEKYLPKKYSPAQEKPLLELEKELANIQKQAEAILKKQGSSIEEIKKNYQTTAATPKDPHQAIKELTDALISAEARMKESGVNLQEAAKGLPGIDPSRLDFGKAIAGLSSLAALIPPTAEADAATEKTEKGDDAKPDQDSTSQDEALKQRIKEGKNLAGLNLDGMNFSGRDLSNANFSGATLTGASFSSSILKGAVFNEALLADADFTGAMMENSRLLKVQAVGAKFNSASLKEADLSAGDFSSASFDRADLTGSTVSGALFAEASLRDIRGGGLTAHKTSFPKADLCGANLQKAILDDADFSNARLDNTNFIGAQAIRATFDGVHASNADFSTAVLTASRADKDTKLVSTTFSGADLTRSCWERTSLTDVTMASATLDHADFSRAQLNRVFMLNVTARETNFLKAVMKDCDMRGMNLFKASFRHAMLNRCDLKDANMFGADLYQAGIVASDTRGTDFRRVQARPTKQSN